MRTLGTAVRGALLALALAVPAESVAQEANVGGVQITPGNRIRLVSPVTGAIPVVAVVRRTTGDSLYLARFREAPFALALADLEQLEVGRINRARGAMYGVGVGVVAGTLLWMPTWCKEGHDTGEITVSDCLAMSLLFGVPSGAVIGAVIGGLMGVESWHSVPLAAELRITGGPRTALVRATVRLP